MVSCFILTFTHAPRASHMKLMLTVVQDMPKEPFCTVMSMHYARKEKRKFPETFYAYLWLSHSFALTVHIAADLWLEMTCIFTKMSCALSTVYGCKQWQKCQICKLAFCVISWIAYYKTNRFIWVQYIPVFSTKVSSKNQLQ